MVVEPQPAVGLERATSLPDGWRLVRFDQMAECVTDRVDNPAEAGVERYVGLEHLDPESLRIRRWGSPTDVEATKLCFKAGDIIFGRRRAYQHKLAVADFEGICSAHALVLRAREDVVIKEFLPLFMQSDLFFDRALAISVGSLSPTINWRTLARQEFPLPPKEEQRRIAEILWATDEALEATREARYALLEVRDAVVGTFLARSEKRPEGWETLPCQRLFAEAPRNGLSAAPNSQGRGYPTLAIGAVRDGLVIPEGNIKYAEIDTGDISQFKLKPGDVLVVRGNGNRYLVGRCGMVDEVPENCFYPDLLIRVSFDPARLRTRFACLQWNAPSVHRQLLRQAKSTSGIWKVNGADLKRHQLIAPPLNEQDRLLGVVAEVERTIRTDDSHLAGLRLVRSSLIEELLRPG